MRLKLRIGLAAIIFGIIIIVADMRDVIITSKEPVKFYDLEVSQMASGVYVEEDIWMIMDYLGTEVTTSNNVEKETAREYVLPIVAEDGESLYIDQIMGLKIRKNEDYNAVESVIRDTVKWWNDETGNAKIGNNTYKIIGVIRNMDKEEKELMLDYAKEAFGDNQIQAVRRVVPYVLEPISRKEVLLYMACGIALFLMGVAFLAWDTTSRRR